MRTPALILIALMATVAVRAKAQVLPRLLRESPERFRWASHFQVRYTAVEDGEDLLALRRLKLMFGGHLNSRVQWFVNGIYKDGNNSGTDGHVYLQDAWVRLALRRNQHLTAGQLRPPFGRERLASDVELVTINRALIDALTPDGPHARSFSRDRGVQLDGDLTHRLRYAVGVFDGGGANHSVRGLAPMAASRMVYMPIH